MRTDETFMGVPIGYVKCYADMFDCMSRAVQQRVVTNDSIFDTSIYVLQGRLEGIAIAWYSNNGEREDTDDVLRAAALEWIAQRRE